MAAGAGDLQDALTGERERLDALLTGIDGDEVGSASADGLRALLPVLSDLLLEAQRLAAGTAGLEQIATRADENLALARLALDNASASSGPERACAARDAVFHARRALTFTWECLRETVERTRQTDRERNRREFLSG